MKYKQTIKLCTILIMTACLSSCEKLNYFERVIKFSNLTNINVSVHEAHIQDEFTDIGKLPILDHGHCWIQEAEGTPTVQHACTHLGTVDHPGQFASHLTELDANASYFVRAYAITEADTVYSEVWSFTTWGLADIDGNLYYTVLIATQEWMRENLRTTRYANGDEIPKGDGVGNISEQDNQVYYFAYDDNYENVETYGLLYTTAAVMNGAPSSNEVPSGVQGVCPSGWHVPSDSEWVILIESLGGEGVAGGKLKEEGTTHWWEPNTGASNSSGFNGLPGGARNWGGDFSQMGEYAQYWTSTESSPVEYIHWDLYFNSSAAFQTVDLINLGFSIRCVKD